MDYKIVPLAYTYPDWATFIKVCQDHLGYSPTRGLDNQGMQPKDPASFLACLTMDNQPLDNLRHGFNKNYTFRHVMFSFLAVLDKRGLDALYYNTDLEIFDRFYDDGECIVIISGNMAQWYQAILRGCREVSPKAIRQIMNQCFNFFRQTGYRELWTSFSERELEDGTFILCLK